MLLAIDVGNTQTVIGLFDETEKLIKHWRLATNLVHTADQKIVEIANLLSIDKILPKEIDAAVVSSVVPACTAAYVEMSSNFLNVDCLIIDSTTAYMDTNYKRPDEIGADRLVNSLAGFRIFGGPIIIVDFGTATTFDVVNKKGVYLGGVITPGLDISADALFKTAARLTKVEIEAPKQIIGIDTKTSVQSGIIFGTAAMVDGIIEKIERETEEKFNILATGGLAETVTAHCKRVTKTEPYLTLLGLQIIFSERS